MKHKRIMLSIFIIFVFSMSYWTPFIDMGGNNATATITNDSQLDLSSLQLTGRPKYAFLDWFNVIPRYYQDVTNVSYIGEFVGNYFDDPNVPGPPIGAYVGYLYDNVKKEYLGQVTTDEGTLFLQRYTVQFPIMFYTKERASALFPDVQQRYYTGTLFDLFWGVYSWERVKGTIQIPYMDLDDQTFHSIGEQKKDGTVLMQAWVDTSALGLCFHDVKVLYQNDVIGNLHYKSDTYAYIESIHPNKYQGGFINPNKTIIANVMGSLPSISEGGQVDMFAYQITASDSWTDIVMKSKANDTEPYSQKYFERSGKSNGFQCTGWYCAPSTLVMPQIGYVLGATPENAKVLTYLVGEEGAGTKIISGGQVIDPNLYREYGNIDTILFSADITLRPQIRRLDLIHRWHNEYKDIDLGFFGWYLARSKSDYDNTITKPMSWTVDNVYIMQDWTASVVVGAYYDWEPNSPQAGPLQHLVYDEGEDVFVNVPEGTIRGGGEQYQIPPEMIALLLQALGLGQYSPEKTLEKGETYVIIILAIILGIIIVIVAAYFYSKKQREEGSKKQVIYQGQPTTFGAMAEMGAQPTLRDVSPETFEKYTEFEEKLHKRKITEKVLIAGAIIGAVVGIILFLWFFVIPYFLVPSIPTEMLPFT